MRVLGVYKYSKSDYNEKERVINNEEHDGFYEFHIFLDGLSFKLFSTQKILLWE